MISSMSLVTDMKFPPPDPPAWFDTLSLRVTMQ
jgi:hypothetical protein